MTPDPNLVTGLFGGTFDPVHLGHLNVARELVRLGRLAQVVFIPAAVPPHKRHLGITSGEHRLAMLRLAVEGEEGLFVSDYELKAGGISYTVDTVRHFRGIFGERLRLVVGMDSLHDLHGWYRSRELLEACEVLVYNRPGYPAPSAAELAERFGAEQGSRLAAGIVQAAPSGISSTEIRKRVRAGNDVSGLLPSRVWGYIQQNRLYN